MDMDMTTPKNNGSSSHKFMMKMYFHGGTMEIVAFRFWEVTDDASMAYSCVIIFLMAFLYEGLKFFRNSMLARQSRSASKPGSSASTLELDGHGGGDSDGWCSNIMRASHVVQTFLHAFQFFISYLLMLIFMTYNTWLCLAVILGAAAGYFVFGWQKKSAVDVTEHCH